MTILTAPGLYIGWDEASIPFTITRSIDSTARGRVACLKLEWGRLVIGIQAPAQGRQSLALR